MPNSNCQFWKDYDSVGGGISYCKLAAFNKPVNPEFLAKIGCTEEKRRQCLETMQLNIGAGVVPGVPLTACSVPIDIDNSIAGVAATPPASSLQVLALLNGAK